MQIYPSLAAMLAVFTLQTAHANPDEYLHLPSVTYTEQEIDFKYGSAKKPSQDRIGAGSIGYGFGVTQNWMSELYIKYKRADGEPTKFDAFEWENKFQLSEPGQYPVDVGFLSEIERPQDRSEGYEITVGPLLQTEFGKLQVNTNFLLQHNFRADQDNPYRLSYQWQAKYRWLPQFEFGAQGFGDLGEFRSDAPAPDKEHRLGPAIFGKYVTGARQAIKYNAAFLFDVGGGNRGNTFRTQIEYEF
jgi:hypothetical protein